MGFLDGALNKLFPPAQEFRNIVIDFGPNWFDDWEALRIAQEEKSFPVQVQVRFNNEILSEIWEAIQNHQASERILYHENQQPINVVGESFQQEGLKEFCNGGSGEDMDWVAGFLIPEMANPYDKNAVAVHLLKPKDSKDNDDTEFVIAQAGYIEKSDAAKVHYKLINLMGKNQYVPLLVKITGGTNEKKNYGVFPYAKTNSIKFP